MDDSHWQFCFQFKAIFRGEGMVSISVFSKNLWMVNVWLFYVFCQHMPNLKSTLHWYGWVKNICIPKEDNTEFAI